MIVDFLLISTNVDHDNSKHVMIMEAAGFWWIWFYPAAYLEAPWQVAVALLMIATGVNFFRTEFCAYNQRYLGKKNKII